MTYRIHRLGWLPDPLDHRDCDTRQPGVRARLNQVVPVLSRSVAAPGTDCRVGPLHADLRDWCSPIEDQGSVGSCTANAVVGALEYFQRKARGEHVDASRLFLYRVTRRFLGWDGRGDTGAFLRSAIKALRLFGALPEQYWRYDEGDFDREPEAFHYAFAQNFKAVEYFRVQEDKHDLQEVLRAGLPFVFGFTCFSSMFEDEVARTGIIPFPRRTDSPAGGHAVMAVGFTDSHVIIRNSWGRGWGDDGYGYLPWTYFDAERPLAVDCWVLVNAAWMPDDEGERPTAATRRRVRAAAKVAKQSLLKPSTDPKDVDERLNPQMRVAVGTDPLRTLPLKLAPRGGLVTLEADAAADIKLPTTSASVALNLRSVKLLSSFDFALFGRAVNELYILALSWDLSGAAPELFPPKPLQDGALRTYNVTRHERVEFVGDGLPIWGGKPVVGCLYVRLIVMESDQDLVKLGKRIEELHDAIAGSELTAALKPLALAAGVSAPALAAVAVGADLLTRLAAKFLQDDDDDLVALFDGSYGADRITESRGEKYTQAGAEVDLELLVGAPPKRRRGDGA